MSEAIKYHRPVVTLLHASPLWIGEVAARTAYASFNKSEHTLIKQLGRGLNDEHYQGLLNINDIKSSEILDQLAWVHHHHSVLELIDLTFSIKGTSRGVLQEHSRHRVQSLTVQSTRYTMSSVLNAYIHATTKFNTEVTQRIGFLKIIKILDMFVYDNKRMIEIEVDGIFDKLRFKLESGDSEINDMLSKEGQNVLQSYKNYNASLFQQLEHAKKKRNVGDKFKDIVSDNWKVDMIVKFNLRSMKNYLDLRTSGSAWHQMQWLANAIKDEIPTKYLRLIDKQTRDSSK